VAKLNDFQAVVDSWLEIDNRLSLEENEAQLRGHNQKAQKIANLRAQNDRAYFLLIFARFEQHLNSTVASFVSQRQASIHWKIRRGWDVVKLGSNLRRTPFLTRLAYVLDKTSPDYLTVSQYYEIRNALAHAGTAQAPFAIPIVEAQLAQIARSLKG
jgi:hypothetical protein